MLLDVFPEVLRDVFLEVLLDGLLKIVRAFFKEKLKSFLTSNEISKIKQMRLSLAKLWNIFAFLSCVQSPQIAIFLAHVFYHGFLELFLILHRKVRIIFSQEDGELLLKSWGTQSFFEVENCKIVKAKFFLRSPQKMNSILGFKTSQGLFSH